jgi:UDP-2-acetamido-2,6-beta-L-arabino-hexul-4-ose reductase
MEQRRTVAITGITGFIGRTLSAALNACGYFEVIGITRGTTHADLEHALTRADAVVHLAGVTRPADPKDFHEGNVLATSALADTMRRLGRKVPIIFSSSIRATEDTLYGSTKRQAELELINLSDVIGNPLAIFRLPQIFGEGAKPHYNSIVATLLDDGARGKKTSIAHPDSVLDLVAVETVVDAILHAIERPLNQAHFFEVAPIYTSTIGEIARLVAGFNDKLATNRVVDMVGLEAALWQAFLGYRRRLSSE